ncbi:hypothetical protein K435DRAFT_968962, partial [Dendrothele bispora CBS 962.96]
MSQPSNSKTNHNTKGWEHYIHPNGWKYFYHPELHIVSSFDVTKISDDFKSEPLPGSEYDVVWPDEQNQKKLFVNHIRRYASFELGDIQDNAKQDDKVDQLHIDYWGFMCRFPAHRSLPKGDGPDGSSSDAFQSALQVLNFFKIDLLRKRSDSEVPFSLSQCKELLEYLNTYKEPSKNIFPGVPSQSVALTALISWIMWTAVKHQQLHKYGQYIQSEQPSLHERLSHSNRFWFHLISSTLLFGGANSHLERISIALITMRLQDRTDAWATFLSTLNQELTVSNLGATVLLSSSTAFLAVPGIDKVPRIVTLISVVITLGSVMTGLYLQWQIEKIKFKDVKIQPTALAIIFSVPFAALIWGIILFAVSVITFSILGTVDSSEQSGQSTTFGSSTWISVLVVSCVLVIIVGALVSVFRMIRYKHSHLVRDVV